MQNFYDIHRVSDVHIYVTYPRMCKKIGNAHEKQWGVEVVHTRSLMLTQMMEGNCTGCICLKPKNLRPITISWLLLRTFGPVAHSLEAAFYLFIYCFFFLNRTMIS